MDNSPDNARVALEERARAIVETLPFERFPDRDVRWYSRWTVVKALAAALAERATPAADQGPVTQVIAGIIEECLQRHGVDLDQCEGTLDDAETILAALSQSETVQSGSAGRRDGGYYASGMDDERKAVLDHLRWWQSQDGDKEPGWLSALIGQIDSGEHFWGAAATTASNGSGDHG